MFIYYLPFHPSQNWNENNQLKFDTIQSDEEMLENYENDSKESSLPRKVLYADQIS